MKLLLIRHSETESNTNDTFNSTNDKLTQKGMLHAESFKMPDSYDWSRIISSDAKRAIHTANLINRMNIPLTITSLLSEKSAGSYAGKKIDFNYLNGLSGDFYTKRIGDGESINDVINRARLFIAFLEKFEPKNCIAITHGGFLKIFLAVLLNLDVESYVKGTKVENLGYCIVDTKNLEIIEDKLSQK